MFKEGILLEGLGLSFIVGGRRGLILVGRKYGLGFGVNFVGAWILLGDLSCILRALCE